MALQVFMRTTTSSDVPPLSLIKSGPVDPTSAALGGQAAIRSAVGAFAFLLYDMLLTFDQEVELIWSRDWSSVKLLYFFVRYFSVLVQIPTVFMAGSHFSQRQCFPWVTFQDLATIMIVLSVDYILLLRVTALYHHNRVVKIILLVSYGVDICALVVSTCLAIPSVTYDKHCTVTNIPMIIEIAGLSLGAFQIILFGFTAVNITQAMRQGRGNARILKLLMRDGTWAFFTLSTTVVVNSILILGPATAYARLLYGWLIPIFSFSGYRVLLNLQRMAPHIAGASSRSVPPWSSSSGSQQFTSVFMSPEIDSEGMESIYASRDAELPAVEYEGRRRPPRNEMVI
ncbi:hypothetical protein PLICRDRAFT_696193 [Plicaturopsis crispa FD-325 SS-3]|nr:hypothetical protein PLICRDRAFT_696193 [Plicaturopsis crispa FD-325 SS-3]